MQQEFLFSKKALLDKVLCGLLKLYLLDFKAIDVIKCLIYIYLSYRKTSTLPSPVADSNISWTTLILRPLNATFCGLLTTGLNSLSESKNQDLALKPLTLWFSSGKRFCLNSATWLLSPGKTNPTTGLHWHTNNTTTRAFASQSPWYL